MKVVQLCNLPIEEIYQQIQQGKIVDRHNVLYGYDYLKEHGMEVIPVSHYKKSLVSKTVNRIGCLIWGGHADYYLQILAMKAASKNKVDVVYCHFLHITPLISFCRRSGLFKYPLVVVAHDAFSQKTTSFKNWKGIDRILVLGERTLDLCKTKEDLSKINCDYIDWGADLELFDKYNMLMTEPSALNSIVAPGVANRDYDTLVKAINDIENINLTVFSSKCELSFPIPNNVFFYKNMDRYSIAKLLPYYYNSIATAIPLKLKLDFCNGSTVLMESMAMHKPVIVTASKVNFIDVKKEKIGLEVDYGDVNGWIEAILYLKEHPDEAKEMGERAYYLAKKRFKYNNFCKKLLFEIEKFKH